MIKVQGFFLTQNFRLVPKDDRMTITLPTYRPDIDGLRAVAVLSVLAFHAFPDLVPGGFIGVDVFFVISGFLIGGIIFREFETNSFSYANFYSRRVRRLFPALLAVLLSTFVFGWFSLLPDEFKQLGKHIAGGVAFVANLVNWHEAGYFDNAAETKPLLHLWSLGVEEQFYILFPIIFAVAARWRRHRSAILVALSLLSFAYCIYASRLNPTAAFYSPLSRFWELMIGCLLAHLSMRRMPATFPGRAVASVAGPLAILIGVALIDETDAFPGVLALVPTLSAFLVIYAGPQTWVNRNILGSKWFVAVGLISYPLYLWHWPILSFCRIVAGATPPLEMRIAALVASFALAWLTYRYIEVPVRRMVLPRSPVRLASLLMVLIGVVGLATHIEDGLKTRSSVTPFTTNAQPLFSRAQGWMRCPPVSKGSTCLIIDPRRPPDVAVLGDSHAGHLVDGMVAFGRENGLNMMTRIRYGCMPFYTQNNDPLAYHTCGDEKGMDAELADAIASDSIKIIVLSGLGFQYAAQYPHLFKAAMSDTLSRLEKSGKRVVFVVAVPSLGFDPKECLHRRPIQSVDQVRHPCVGDAAAYRVTQSPYLAVVKEMAMAFPGVRFIDTTKWFIDEDKLKVKIGDELLYNDHTHLTPAGTRYLFSKIGPELLTAMAGIGKAGP